MAQYGNESEKVRVIREDYVLRAVACKSVAPPNQEILFLVLILGGFDILDEGRPFSL